MSGESFRRAARFRAMPSTVIESFEYHAETAELVITFTNGRRYIYCNVPDDAIQRFRAAFSKGSHFNRYIRDHYRYRELV